MAKIDHTIYSQMRAPDILGGFLDGYSQGQQIRETNEKRKKQQDLSDAMKSGVVTGADGSKSYDSDRTYQTLLGKGFVSEAEDIRQNQAAQQKASRENQQFRNSEIANGLFAAAKDPRQYPAIRADLIKRGLISENDAPPVHDAGFVRTALMRFSGSENYLKNQQAEANLNKTNAEIRKMNSTSGKQTGENLPIDSKKFVDTLAAKNANKTSIRTTLDAFLGKWDALSEDQKIIQGRQLLKTLNSPEGADAIGAEEAKRLGNLLEYKILNFTEPGSFIGRDLGEFKSQVENTRDIIKEGITSNQSQIDEMMGRSTKQAAPDAGSKKPAWAL